MRNIGVQKCIKLGVTLAPILISLGCAKGFQANLSSSNAGSTNNSESLETLNKRRTPAPTPTPTPTPAAIASLSAPVATSDATNVYYKVSYSGYPAAPSPIRIFLDTDSNAATGFQYGGLGADYMLQDGMLQRYSGTGGSWGWTLVQNISFTIGNGAANWSLARANVGNPSSIKLMAQTPTPEVGSVVVAQSLTTPTATPPPPPPATPTPVSTPIATPTPTPTPPPTSAGSIQPIPTLTAPMPTSIADGSTISLNCGTTYYGALNLGGKSNVTVNTSGTCGRAVITPAAPVSGWTQYSGNIYVAAAPTEITQVFVNSQLIGIAHYPNSVDESGWLQPSNITATSMDFSSLPSADIVGAKATYRGTWPWAIGTRTVTAYNGTTLTLPANTNADLNSEDCTLGKFYLEGKLWMLDSPGEWAWSAGKLYVWMPDGAAPGTRVLAATNVNSAVDATGTTNVTLDGVRVVGGWIGINAGYNNANGKSSSGLRILNTEIAYSNWSGIYATNAHGLNVSGSQVIGALHTGVYARYGSVSTVIASSVFTNVNMVGMHKGSDGTIFLLGDAGATISNNTLTNSGKAAIFLGSSSDSLIKGNIVDGACRVHGDCGGIYLFDRAQVPLNTRIESNRVSNVNGTPVRAGSTNPERYGIYLDDYATGVTLVGNTVNNNATGLMLHGAFNNTFSQNSFSGNVQRHVYFSESGTTPGGMRGNAFNLNTFTGPVLAFVLEVGSPTNAGSYSGNTYLNYGTGAVGSPSTLPYRN